MEVDVTLPNLTYNVEQSSITTDNYVLQNRPFACPLCNKRCVQANGVIAHMYVCIIQY